MHTPDQRLHELANHDTTPGWLRRLIPELLQRDPVDVAQALESVSTLFRLRADWSLGNLRSRQAMLQDRDSADVVLIGHNPEGTDGVCVWQGRGGAGSARADVNGKDIVEGAWYVIHRHGQLDMVVSGPLYPLSDAAEAAARFLARRRKSNGIYKELTSDPLMIVRELAGPSTTGLTEGALLEHDMEGPIARTVATARKYRDQGVDRDAIMDAIEEGWSDWPEGMIQEVLDQVEREVFGQPAGRAQ